ncbi:hypothetical protein MSMAL_1878 [Methanosarcina mazei LYC]|uniref:Uncharacterized protein n=1 Tax=Methanosarcina mazei LYC TaxID=1434114 RepID=A0A0E3LWA3_METMZ|nr:hypothetical protein MSMAL_1878 [Methanosarcina mazei LYC]
MFSIYFSVILSVILSLIFLPFSFSFFLSFFAHKGRPYFATGNIKAKNKVENRQKTKQKNILKIFTFLF